MANKQEIQSQLDLLSAHRRTLSIYLKQLALRGGEGYTPPEVINGILEARENIRRIKATLQGWGVKVTDDPDDERSPFEPDPDLPTYRPVPGSGTNDFDWQAFQSGGCLGKLLMTLGVLISLVGAGIFAFAIFSGFSRRGDLFPEIGPLGFGIAFGGMVVYLLGRFTVYAGISTKRKRKSGFSGTVIIITVLITIGILTLIIKSSLIEDFLSLVKDPSPPSEVESIDPVTPIPQQGPTGFSYHGHAEVIYVGLLVRRGPGIDYPVVDSNTLVQGMRVPILQIDNDSDWLLVQLPTGKTGWISGRPEYVRIIK